MDPEDRDLLERTFKLARDNNRMLQAMGRAALFNGLFRVLAWAVVLGGSLWFYFHYVGPAISSTTHTINQVQGVSDNANTQFQMFRSLLSKLQQTLPNVASSTGK
jgi:hypothetical protein